MAARSEDLYLGRRPNPAPARRRFTADQVQARRRTLVTTAVLVLAVMFFMLATGPEGAVQASRSDAPKVVNVQPGQSLWDLAERYAAPGQDPRAYVDAITELNDLEGFPLVGQRLRLPR